MMTTSLKDKLCAATLAACALSGSHRTASEPPSVHDAAVQHGVIHHSPPVPEDFFLAFAQATYR